MRLLSRDVLDSAQLAASQQTRRNKRPTLWAAGDKRARVRQHIIAQACSRLHSARALVANSSIKLSGTHLCARASAHIVRACTQLDACGRAGARAASTMWRRRRRRRRRQQQESIMVSAAVCLRVRARARCIETNAIASPDCSCSCRRCWLNQMTRDNAIISRSQRYAQSIETSANANKTRGQSN